MNEPKEQKECPDDKILNPATNRCVLKTSAIGKKLLKPEPELAPKPASKKECPDGKILNPKTNRCIKKKIEKNPNEPPKKRGRPKKELIIDINEPKNEKRTNLEKELIKSLPKIPISFFYDIDKVIKEIDESNDSTSYKLGRIKYIIDELNEIQQDTIERKNEATEKKKLDYIKFLEYNTNRKIKANKYYDEILIKYNDIKKKGSGLPEKQQLIQSIIFDKSIYKLPESLIYMIKNNYKINKIDETDNFYRYRQIEPNLLKKKGYINYKTIEKQNGIKEVISY